MTTSKESINVTDTVCTICHEPFNNPVELKCLHRFCKECIERYAEHTGDSKTLPCPLCRQHSKLAEGSCFSHEKSTTPSASAETDQLKKEKHQTNLTCPHHPNDVRYFYCRTCNVFICMHCTVVDHPRDKHEIVNRSDIEDELNKTIGVLTEQCKAKRQKISKHVEDIRKCELEASTAINKIKDSIQKAEKDAIEQVTKDIKLRAQSLLAETTKIHKAITTATTNSKVRNEQLDTNIQSTVSKLSDIARTTLSNESIRDFGLHQKLLQEKLGEDIGEKNTDASIKYIAELRFEPEQSSVPIIDKIVRPMTRQQASSTSSKSSATSVGKERKSSTRAQPLKTDKRSTLDIGSKSVEKLAEKTQPAVAIQGVISLFHADIEDPLELRKINETITQMTTKGYENCRDATVLPNGNIAVLYSNDCVVELTLGGHRKRIIDGILVRNITSLPDGKIVVCTKDWELYLFSSDGKKLDVDFLVPENCGDGYLTTNHHNKCIYVSYPELWKICVYRQTGGGPVHLIDVGMLYVTTLCCTGKTNTIARVSDDIKMLDNSGAVIVSFPSKHGNCWRYPAIDNSGKVYVASIQKASGMVYIDKFDQQGSHTKTITTGIKECVTYRQGSLCMLMPHPGVIVLFIGTKIYIICE